MQFARFAVQAEAVPIEHPIGRVGVLLDFKDDQARAERVNPAAGQEHGVARPHAHAMKTLGHGASLDLLLELGAGDAAFQADIKLRARRGLGDIPHLGLRFAAQFRRFGRPADGLGARACPAHRGS